MRRLLLLLLLMVVVSIGGCPSPAAPPGPPAELPSSLVLPNPTIDVSEISAAPGPSLSALVGSGGELSDEIAIAPNRIGDSNSLFGTVLEPFRSIAIPVSESTSTLASDVTLAGTGLEAKLDFAPFDYDGDGHIEPCSGNTAVLPICLRMWVGGEPFMEAVFDQFPTADSAGRGRLKAVVLPSFGGGDAGVRFASVYDHSNALNKVTDFFFFAPPESFAKTYRRALITEEGAEGRAKKSINFSDRFFFDPSNPDTVQYIGSFLQNRDFWSGSLEISPKLATEVPGLGNLSNACAQITTGNPVLEGTCLDLGIDTAGQSFIDFASDADFELFDFPAAPTF